MKSIPLLLLLLICSLATLDLAKASPLDELAIQDRGRKKPLSTFTQEMTMLLTGKSKLTLQEQSFTPSEFILSLWLEKREWAQQPILLVDYLPLRRELGLAVKEKRFAVATLKQNLALQRLQNEVTTFQRQKPNEKLPPLLSEVSQVTNRLQLFTGLTDGSLIRLVPHPTEVFGPWKPLPPAIVSELQRLHEESPTAFMARLAALVPELRSRGPQVYPAASSLALEAVYQHVHPWRWAWIAYATAALVLLLTFQWQAQLGHRLALALALGGFVMHLFGFVARILISGRAPVTNMYESIVWVAFGTILFALIFEIIYKSRYFLLAATPIAVAALILTDLLPLALDSSIQPLVAVLNNNFWLTIHVLTITLSYGAFALALGLGHVLLLQRWRGASALETQTLALYNYRSLQIGVLLLAAGTILGGVWANYSWGRFWDWDPKETWALIALLGYLIILHGRLAGWWGGFGLAVGSILGFQAVVMAWYGVNFVLGKGLHSYGFGTGGVGYAVAYVLIEFAFIAFIFWQRPRRLTAS
jgi:cytochrome c-type biogenesis protein CcsB